MSLSRNARPPNLARGLIRSILPLASILLFQGGFAVAVMYLGEATGGGSRLLPYVALVESISAFLFLTSYAIHLVLRRKKIEAAAASPLDSALPTGRGYIEASWMAFASSLGSAAREEAARREAASKEELEAFLSTVHALKTPATALSLMAERSERDGKPIQNAELRAEIEELDRVLDRAIGRLRLDDFEKGTRIGEISAAEAIRASIKKHRRILIARRIQIAIDGDFSAMCDRYWLSFILDQLVSNASKYAASRIDIRLSTQGRAGMIEISDDGPGLDEEDELRVFGKSASGSAGLRSGELTPASSGYGLYLASEAAKRLGILIGFEKADGAKAFLRLPAALSRLDDLSTM